MRQHGVIVISGASAGVGRAIVRKLAGRADAVALLARGEDGLAVAARAVASAVDHPRRREHWVGMSTVMTILAQRIAPGLVDRCLTSTGFEAQKRPDVPPPREDNLFRPLDTDRDYGAHGEFDDQSQSWSAQSWMNEHRKELSPGAAGVVLAASAVPLWNRFRSKKGVR